jgi:crotonobetainyl-CoA:carnitine CoA-transferase CaiB-like acyl-CoA transferase
VSFRPLEGIRVLDLTRLLPGPYLSQCLTDLGADVVKLEEPGAGDPARLIEGSFAAVNRGKRSMAMDLKARGASEALLRMLPSFDALLESFRPGVMARLGLADAELARANPRLVRVSLVGYGPGPLRDAVGHDINYEAVAGVLAAQGDLRAPVLSAVQVADVGGALYALAATMGALLERERTGRGRHVEVALADAALAMNVLNAQRGAGEAPARGGGDLTGGIPSYRLYRCRDGRFLALGCLEPRFWARFCEAVGKAELAPLHAERSRGAHLEVEALFASRTSHEWEALLGKAGVPATLVVEPRETAPLFPRFEGAPGPGSPLTHRPSHGKPPALGEHTDEVLREAGFRDEEIAALREAGALGPQGA